MWRRLADWCVPAGAVMPRHLTRGDPVRVVAVGPLTDSEYADLKARWEAAYGNSRNTMVLPVDFEGEWD